MALFNLLAGAVGVAFGYLWAIRLPDIYPLPGLLLCRPGNGYRAVFYYHLVGFIRAHRAHFHFIIYRNQMAGDRQVQRRRLSALGQLLFQVVVGEDHAAFAAGPIPEQHATVSYLSASAGNEDRT